MLLFWGGRGPDKENLSLVSKDNGHSEGKLVESSSSREIVLIFSALGKRSRYIWLWDSLLFLPQMIVFVRACYVPFHSKRLALSHGQL